MESCFVNKPKPPMEEHERYWTYKEHDIKLKDEKPAGPQVMSPPDDTVSHGSYLSIHGAASIMQKRYKPPANTYMPPLDPRQMRHHGWFAILHEYSAKWYE